MHRLIFVLAALALYACQKSGSGSVSTAPADTAAQSPPATTPTADATQPSALETGDLDGLIKRLVPPESNSGGKRSEASYRMRGNVAIVEVSDHDDNEMTSGYRSGLFTKENGTWKSMLEHELIRGRVDSVLDLNEDYSEELIVVNDVFGSAGGNSYHILYAVGDKLPYKEIGTFAVDVHPPNALTAGATNVIEYVQNKGGMPAIIVTTLTGSTEPERVYTSKTKAYNFGEMTLTSALAADHFLWINGNDIWVRDAPSTGQVVMKLKSGDKCRILEKGKTQTIKDKTDVWYKIDFNGKVGWVFGSQTSVRSN